MAKIEGIAKWNLEKGVWQGIKTLEDAKKALSIVTYYDIIHDESDLSFNYIIIADGYRVENLSKDAKNVSERRDGIKKVLDYFEKRKANYRIQLLFVDNDAPLREEGKYFASYIDLLASTPNVKSVNYLGFSKCGAIGFDMIKYMKRPQSLAKTNIFCISTPYTGTILASPEFIAREARRVIEAKIGKNTLSEGIIRALLDYYRKVSSNSHMDYDIALPGGVKGTDAKRYDRSFIENMFSNANLEARTNVNHFQNICTVIDETTTKKILKSRDLTGIGLLLLDRFLFREPSDGMVTLKSQQTIESHAEFTEKLIIPSPHAILTGPYRERLLDEVDRVIEEKPFIIKLKK